MSSQPNDPAPEAGLGETTGSGLTLDETLAQALEKAAACRQAGQLDEAERLCRAILQARPEDAAANHQLGLLAVLRRQVAVGLPHFLAALEAAPESSQYWRSYIEALILAGEPETARQVLALGRQHGLAGEAVEALARSLDGGPVTQDATRRQQAGSRERPAAALRGRGADRRRGPAVDDENRLIELFSAARYADGETLARTLSERFPRHGFGWKALGAILHAQGRDREALTAMRRAAKLLPRDEQVQSNLGVVLANMGKLPEGEACQRRALQIRPEFAEAHYNLGNVLSAQHQHREAATSYRQALGLTPDFAPAHLKLGDALMELGCPAEAAESYQRALVLDPDSVATLNGLGTAQKALGRLVEAEASYRRALTVGPDHPELHNNLGDTLRDLGRLSEAESALRRALELKPDFAAAHFNLGITLNDRGRWAEAAVELRLALRFQADFPEALVVLGSALRAQGQLDAAAESVRCALRYRPHFAEAYYNLGNILRDQERHSEAEASFRRSLELKPDQAHALLNLGVTLTERGRYGEAEAACRRALELRPDYPLAHSDLLFCLSHNEDISAAALFAEHCRFGERFEAPLRAHWRAHTNSRDPQRGLQVGFVSADLRNHAVASYIEPVLARLAMYRQLSLHAYSNHRVEDDVTERMRQHFAHWHAIAGVSDDALAERIRADAIDILIDLSGHTAHHRLLTFARKPAPLQASWIGYPGTTGLQAMDYFLADRFFLPFGEFDRQFTEKIVRLPANAPFLPFADAPPVSPLAALNNGHVTFGSFNRPTKISPSVVALWSRLLNAVPDSRLVLGAMRPDGRADELIDDFAANGVARERLSFLARSDMPTYLDSHREVDICLDTFPYTGGTTSLHALWMGVPTLTLAGDTVPGRSGASILGHVGLETFIALNAADFVARGVSWANDLPALARLRPQLRERLRSSAMGQPELVAAGLERALRTMWQRWCAGLPAAAFEVVLEQRSGLEPASAT